MQGEAQLPEPVRRALLRLGLIGPDSICEALPLSGGVSSHIWRVRCGADTYCVKQALARLQVADVWTAPLRRNDYEAAWLRTAAALVPDAVPRLLGQDPAEAVLVMEFLAEDLYPNWKQLLSRGIADSGVGKALARVLATVHGGTAGSGELARRFATDDLFHALRIEPYLLTAAARHPRWAPTLRALAETTVAHKLALVHGDVSPKNVLLGPRGPVLLDAECAWYGDPAFDLAFCLNHLLLKCLWQPRAASAYLACFQAMAASYLALVDWESPGALEARAAGLLPGLMLARVDGKSPVEYLTTAAAKDRVRAFAGALLQAPATRLDALGEAWAGALRDAGQPRGTSAP